MSWQEAEYLFSGTTRGWLGNDALQRERVTCTTTDPLVATLFALECRNWGSAAILTIHAPDLLPEEQSERDNFFAVIESAVNLRITPAEFEKRAELILDVDQALDLLHEMGFTGLPLRFPNRQSLQIALEESHNLGQRLSREQIHHFVVRARGDHS